MLLMDLGTFRGNWANATAYATADLFCDTAATSDIFIVTEAHTSSGSHASNNKR